MPLIQRDPAASPYDRLSYRDEYDFEYSQENNCEPTLNKGWLFVFSQGCLHSSKGFSKFK